MENEKLTEAIQNLDGSIGHLISYIEDIRTSLHTLNESIKSLESTIRQQK